MIDKKNDPVLDIDFLREELPRQIESFCYTWKIEDLRQESESTFQGLLQTIAGSLFDRRLQNRGEWDNRGSILLYDDHVLFFVYEWFVMISRIYNKTCNPYNFSILSGINITDIEYWYSCKDIANIDIDINDSSIIDNDIYNRRIDIGDRYKVTSKRYIIAKNLYKAYEESLAAALTAGKNPVGIIATLNRRYGWNAAEMSIQSKPQIIAAQDLPVLAPPDPE